MVAARSPAEAMAVLARETAWHYGPVPHSLAGVQLEPGYRCIADGCFLLRCESGYGYLYQPGAGITIERPENADPDEEILWLNGSVYDGVACLNGFLPFHASAVAHNGRVFAFTGPGGAGKSTLAAGLGAKGFPLFCDDTLLIDLATTDRVLAMPGHKRLKLREDAFALTGATPVQPVGADTGKHYALPLAGDVGQPLTFDTLVFLAEGPELAWEPITGAERFARLADDHYTQDIFAEAARPSAPAPRHRAGPDRPAVRPVLRPGPRHCRSSHERPPSGHRPWQMAAIGRHWAGSGQPGATRSAGPPPCMTGPCRKRPSWTRRNSCR